MIDPGARLVLLNLARAALEARVRGLSPPPAPMGFEVSATGVFVTIHCAGALRGCLGTLEPCAALADAVARLAAEVAHEDPRFDPVAPHELPLVTLDLSVLSAPVPVADPSEIEIGRDGLIIEHGRRRGLLLPQVATEHGWSCEEFLAHTCVKAGLRPDAWRRGAAILRFEAEVFGEPQSLPGVRQ